MLFMVPHRAAAFDPYSQVKCGQAANTAVCKDKDKGDPLTGDNGVIIKIANIVAYIAGAVAVIMIIVGALKYITSGSDISTSSRTDTDVEDARHMITNALIGLVVIILAKVLISYVINKIN
jgi:Type IV secretion system pilin